MENFDLVANRSVVDKITLTLNNMPRAMHTQTIRFDMANKPTFFNTLVGYSNSNGMITNSRKKYLFSMAKLLLQ